jgi:hypothetical protein
VKGNGTTSSPKRYSYVDGSCSSGNYKYRLKQIDNDGSFEYSNIVEVEIEQPKYFELFQNYPNPFNPETTIKYSLSENAEVQLSVYNILGENVATLVNENQTAGIHNVQFNAAGLASGIYIYRLKIKSVVGKNFAVQKKMIVMK